MSARTIETIEPAVLASRPTAGITYLGSTFYATDELKSYACIKTGASTYTWKEVDASWKTITGATGFVFGTGQAVAFASGSYLDVAGTPTAAPEFGPGQSLVVLIYPLSTPAGSEHLMAHINIATTRGWVLASGYEADRSSISLFLVGITGADTSSTINLPVATWAGALNTPHVIAIAIAADKTVRYSWDGGTVQVVAPAAGTYVPTNSGDPFTIGCFVDGAVVNNSAQIGQVRTYSTILSDANLVNVAASRTSYELADPTAGTLTLDLKPEKFLGGFKQRTINSQSWRLFGSCQPIAR